MNAITISLETEFTPESRGLLEALHKHLNPRFVAPEPATADLFPDAKKMPAIGEDWPGINGKYGGLSRGEDGEPDGHLVLLDVAPEEHMNWADAVKWAEALGDGARLPTRFESALLYANLRDQFDTDDWHWTGTKHQLIADCAWTQNFLNGGQTSSNVSYEARVRAVRRLPL